MGRKYNGMDYQKVTVKLDERQFDIVRQYGFRLQKEAFDEQDRTGKVKPYHWKMSDSIRAALDLLGIQNQLSDNMETSAANLLDIAEIFDKVEGKNASMYAQAIREAAALLLMFCYNAEWGYDGEKIVFKVKGPTKSKQGKKKIRETEVTIRSADGPPLIRDPGGPQETAGPEMVSIPL